MVYEQQGNRIVEKLFWSTLKKKLEEELKKLERDKHSIEVRVAKWPDLEEEVKMWIRGHRNNGILLSTKVIVF
jgi:hypothetical protein